MPKKTTQTSKIDLSSLDHLIPGHRHSPVWTGPNGEGPQGGITFSLLCRFLNCRERFRLLVVEGLKSREGFNHRLEFGSMWHIMEEDFAIQTGHDNLHQYMRDLIEQYPSAQEQIQHWYQVCKIQFPIYLNFWAKQKDVIERQPLITEQAFDVPYQLPSGRTVRLRGKWDSVDLIGKGKGAGLYLQENKTKGDIKPQQLQRQLASGFDLQTMLYLVSLHAYADDCRIRYSDGNTSVRIAEERIKHGIKGIRYNVIRRPLSGGKHTIRPHQATSKKRAESMTEFYCRLAKLIEEDPEHYFMRWKVEIQPADIKRFRTQCLDPILEQLCDWWYYIDLVRTTDDRDGDPLWNPVDLGVRAAGNNIHFRHPYGVFNILDEGGSSEYDEYLDHASEIGLSRTADLFPELKEER